MASIANVVILFTDQVKSTELTSGLSTMEAEDLRTTHFSALRNAVSTSEGSEVKSTGDGLMVVFPSATSALDCAVAMQQAFRRHNLRTPQHPLHVRVGISTGDATVEKGDYYGDCAVEAARLCAAAAGGQVLVADVVRSLARRSGHGFVARQEVELKGFPEPVVAWELEVPSLESIGVAVIEDHPLYRQGLMQTIEATPGLDLVASAGSLKEMDTLGFAGVQVVLLDLHLPDGEGADLVSRVTSMGPAVLVVSASEDRQSVVEAIGAGASGYLPKSAAAEEIATATTVVSGGGTYVSPILAAYLLSADREGSSDDRVLTSREREILLLVADGDTDGEIAERLFISIRTVRSHLDRIRDKTGRRRRAELTRLALEQHRDHR
jgi:DNA-binding NarL/FixJ family response regulator